MAERISFQPVRKERDLTMLHQWMHEPHVVPFWNLALSIEKYEAHLDRFLQDPHQQLHIGSVDSVPMSYFETYWVKDDVIGRCYDFHPEDQGVHLLIGPPAYLGKGYAQPLLQDMTTRLFQHEATEKVIAEPDVRNHKMIHIFQKCGYVPQREVALPDKQGLLMFCTRDTWRAALEGGNQS
ncbi:GNAT family N-acetyltransferase [Marinicrinis sediminis]|uniref:Lysine N-acyltransferase MbtK n=1 Tax=Marinicrinis sediminis TaxID=1652465 RepID=A0ABW5RBK2_9BACL